MAFLESYFLKHNQQFLGIKVYGAETKWGPIIAEFIVFAYTKSQM